MHMPNLLGVKAFRKISLSCDLSGGKNNKTQTEGRKAGRASDIRKSILFQHLKPPRLAQGLDPPLDLCMHFSIFDCFKGKKDN